MKLIILPLLCMGIAYVRGQSACEISGSKPEGCYDDPVIAKILCTETNKCVCNPAAETVCTDVIPDIFDGTAAEMNGQKCEEICKASSDCEFYRWEKDSAAKSEHCSLMDINQCTSYEPCTGDYCQSGQADCQPGPVPHPTGKKCKNGALFTSGNIHWKCINPLDEISRIDIYADPENPEEIILPGTICFTERKCEKFDVPADDDPAPPFLYHTYVIICNEGRDDVGKWAKYEESTNNPAEYIGNGFALSDPPCVLDLEPLVLDTKVLTESGVSFICSEGGNLAYGDTDVTVTDPNTCALLCNFHHVMTIEPKYQENDGTSEWWKYTTGEGDEGEKATRLNVYCWSQPEDPTT